jgi:uroporphyrinogen-III synthase
MGLVSDTVDHERPLAGRRVALPETRELDRLAALFEEEGATAVRCPLVTIVDSPEPDRVDCFLRLLAEQRLDDLVLLTGEGLRRLMARATQTGLEREVRAGLARARKITRGPKPARALHELGLAPDLPARTPTTPGVIETLGGQALQGRRVGVQLYGADPNDALISFLVRAGAEVATVAPYLYAAATDADAGQVAALVAALREGTVDAVAFTSAAQVDRLFAVAEVRASAEALRAALARTLVAAVGPVAAEALRAHGVTPRVVPEKPFVMKRLVSAVIAALTGQEPAAAGRLRGRRIALPEHRELDRLAEMLAAEGAIAVRCPLMAILDAPDPEPVLRWLVVLAGGQLDDVVFLTGEGVQRLMQAATRAGLGQAVLAALARVRKITRGPKPARVLHQLGLSIDLAASAPTSQGVMDCLRGQPLTGRRVGLQLYGDDPSRELVAFLEAQGAQVAVVAPYRYAPASDDASVEAIVDQLAEGGLDAIAFTTAMQIEHLFRVARRRDKEEKLRAGLAQVHVAAVGPLVREALRGLGVRVDSGPARQFFMRRLTEEMAEKLGPRPAPVGKPRRAGEVTEI